MSELADWMKDRVGENGWSNNELGRRAGLSSASISLVMTGRQKPGLRFCLGVAKALDEPPERVLRLAALLPPAPERDEVVEELLFHFERMPEDAQKHFLVIARALAEE